MTNWLVGGIYSMKGDGGKFSVVKILAIDENAVHVRLYDKKYWLRPKSADPSKLDFVIGHLPLSHEVFATWQPLFISQAAVSDDELTGYKLWEEDAGGVWSV